MNNQAFAMLFVYSLIMRDLETNIDLYARSSFYHQNRYFVNSYLVFCNENEVLSRVNIDDCEVLLMLVAKNRCQRHSMFLIETAVFWSNTLTRGVLV